MVILIDGASANSFPREQTIVCNIFQYHSSIPLECQAKQTNKKRHILYSRNNLLIMTRQLCTRQRGLVHAEHVSARAHLTCVCRCS